MYSGLLLSLFDKCPYETTDYNVWLGTEILILHSDTRQSVKPCLFSILPCILCMKQRWNDIQHTLNQFVSECMTKFVHQIYICINITCKSGKKSNFLNYICCYFYEPWTNSKCERGPFSINILWDSYILVMIIFYFKTLWIMYNTIKETILK